MTYKQQPMSDEEFAVMVGAAYEQIRSMRRNSDYVVNQPQMDKFDELLTYFAKKTAEYDSDEIERISLEPVDERGDLSAHFLVFNVGGEADVQEFCKVISYCSAFCVNSVIPEGIRISVTVPDVFVKKS